MDRLISEQAVIDTIDKWVKSEGILIVLPATKVTPLFDGIHNLPPVNPQEPKTGYWIDIGSGQECSKCHEIQYGYDSFRFYCAKCGSKNMEG